MACLSFFMRTNPFSWQVFLRRFPVGIHTYRKPKPKRTGSAINDAENTAKGKVSWTLELSFLIAKSTSLDLLILHIAKRWCKQEKKTNLPKIWFFHIPVAITKRGRFTDLFNSSCNNTSPSFTVTKISFKQQSIFWRNVRTTHVWLLETPTEASLTCKKQQNTNGKELAESKWRNRWTLLG